MDQYLRDVSDDQVTIIVSTIGQERLTAYLASTPSLRDALQLYQTNGRLAKHIHEVMGGFEIALRNRISASIANHYGREDWYRCRAFVQNLNTERRSNIRDIRERLKTQKQEERAGRIIAGLSLHFWISLHENKYRDSLWTPHLHRVWPKGENLKQVHKDLLKARDLRNRIAHHEPIFQARWHDRIEAVWLRFEQLAPEMAGWYEFRLSRTIDALRHVCRQHSPTSHDAP
ncbi:Abi family protein [Allorhizobium pseudoryzae]|uniref:Abi family protein n=1 Tax=Allorhizobium pseudoryzae TaxID=379684 RepID=UPI003D0584B8